MTGSKEVLSDLIYQLLKVSHVTIGDGSELKVLGHVKVVISPDTSIEKVLLVEIGRASCRERVYVLV